MLVACALPSLSLLLLTGPTTHPPRHQRLNTAGAVTTGVLSFGSLAGLAAVLFAHKRTVARMRTREVLTTEWDRLADDLACEGPLACAFWYPRRSIREAGTAGWPLLLTMSSTGFAVGAGWLSTDVRPLHSRRAQTVVLIAGGVLAGAGTTTWLAGRLRKPSKRCYDSLVDGLSSQESSRSNDVSCVDRWFSASAGLLVAGATALSAGAALITAAAHSRTTIPVTPAVAFTPHGATLSLTGRF